MKTTAKGYTFTAGYQGKQRQVTFFFGRKQFILFRALPVFQAS